VQVEPLATQLPYMTCIGNHERDFPNSGSYYTGSDSGGTSPPKILSSSWWLVAGGGRLID
jgi:hypothetical protein